MKRVSIFIVIVLAMLIAKTSHSTTVIEMDFDEQARGANLVVTGKVAGDRPVKWRGYPCTILAVNVEDHIAGEAGATIEVLIPGDDRVKVMGAARLNNGEEYLLFLEKLPEGYYRVLGFNQGAHSVIFDKNSGRKIVKIGKRGKERPYTLDSAKKRILLMRENSPKAKAAK